MSRIVELAQEIETEIEMTRAMAEQAHIKIDEIEEKNRHFKRRLIELLDEFYPDY